MAENDCQGEDPVMMLVERLRAPETPWHARDEAAEMILSLSQERDRLKDPAVVHANMLRGTIAKISMDQCAHTHGAQFNDLEVAEAKLAEVSQERDRLREIADLTHSILNGCEWWIIETPNEGALAKAFALLGRPITAKETRRDIDRDYADFRAALNKEPPCQET